MTDEWIILPDRYEAIIADLDGVITQSAGVHAAAWKEAFDEFLVQHSRRTGEDQKPFEVPAEYLRHVDGRPRYDGVQTFLDARGISLPWGSPEDRPDQATVCGIGNNKNRKFTERIAHDGVELFDSSVEFLQRARDHGLRLALVSASKNARALLAAVELTDLFEVIVDGIEAEQHDLAGKPHPDTFLEAARRLAVPPGRAVIIEDALSGVTAGRRGEFGCVVGVARSGNRRSLEQGGADVVVEDLSELTLTAPHERSATRRKASLPDAMRLISSLETQLAERQLAVFLDFDGTLAPIVDDPAAAELPESARNVVHKLAGCVPTAIVSGRDLDDVKGRVNIAGLWYAGSHGFEIRGPHGEHFIHDAAQQSLPALDEAEARLRSLATRVAGAELERKGLSLAIHVRKVDARLTPVVKDEVHSVASHYPELRLSEGRKVFDLGPKVEWHKGKAIRWILRVQGLASHTTLPLYIGDDVTDEGAFQELAGDGLTITVLGGPVDTHATHLLPDPPAVEEFLSRLAQTLVEADRCQSGA